MPAVKQKQMRPGIQIFTLLLLTSLLANADSPVSDAPNNQKHSAIAKSDSGWLVVWEDQRTRPAPDVWGQLINSDGSLRDANFPICTASVKECHPAIQWLDTCYLIAWEQDQGGTVSHVYGRFLDWTGTSTSPAFPIAEAANSVHPGISPGGSHWVVAWADYRNGTDLDVYGQLLDGNGNLVGLPIPISQATDQQSHAAIAWNGVHWLAVWEDKRGDNSDIYGQLIDSAGGLVGANFAICQAEGNQQYPEIVWAENNWFVAWSDYRSGSCYDIYAVALDASGNPQSAELPIAVDLSRNSYYPRVTWHEQRSWFVVVWADYETKSRILRRNVDTLWNLTATYLVSSSPSNAWYPAISGDGTDCIVVWEDDRNGNWDIYTYVFDPVGVEEETNCQWSTGNVQLSVHPNPFIHNTVIIVGAPRTAERFADRNLLLHIHDLSGRLVRSLQISKSPNHQISKSYWDGKDSHGKNMEPGIYFCQLRTSTGIITRKLIRMTR
jgi:beta propeller repeat protein